MNHKEMVRQISELNSEDFSLLQLAVSERESQSTPTTLHAHLEVEDLEDSSISEQLDRLLESLRQSDDVCCSDSGAVSDLESSGTGLEGGGRSNSVSTSVLDTCNGSGSESLEDIVSIPLVGEVKYDKSSGQGLDEMKKESDIQQGCEAKMLTTEDVWVKETKPRNGQTVESKSKVTSVADVKTEHESRLEAGLEGSTVVAGHPERNESVLMSEGGPFITQRRRQKHSGKKERRDHPPNSQTPKQGMAQGTKQHRSTSTSKSKASKDSVSGCGLHSNGTSPRPGDKKGRSVGRAQSVQAASNFKMSYAKVAGLAQVASNHEMPPVNAVAPQQQWTFNYSEIVEFLWNGKSIIIMCTVHRPLISS